MLPAAQRHVAAADDRDDRDRRRGGAASRRRRARRSSPRRSARRRSCACRTVHSTASTICVVVHGDDAVDERLHVGERQVAGTDRHQAVGDARRCCASVTGWPASSDAFIAAAPAGSTPMTRTAGPRLLDRGRDAGGKAAAADRHEHRRDVRTLLEDLEPGRSLAGDDPLVIERRHHRQAARRRFALRRAPGARPRSCRRR